MTTIATLRSRLGLAPLARVSRLAPLPLPIMLRPMPMDVAAMPHLLAWEQADRMEAQRVAMADVQAELDGAIWFA